MDSRIRYIAILILLALSAGPLSGREVREHAVFCLTDGRIVADSCAMMPIAEWRDRIVREFLKSTAVPGDISSINYCDRFYSLSIDDSTRISVDYVTFPFGNEALTKWLNDIPDSTYIEPDIPAEAPEKCIAIRKSSTLVIVWCNLFADTDEVFNKLY